MTEKEFNKWLRKLKNVWESRKYKNVINLVANKFLWYETPFSKPLKTKTELLKEWKSILNQEDVHVSNEILSVSGSVGISKWRATFTRLPSKQKSELEGIFKVSLNEKGDCFEFHQWYNSKE